ncbi:MAG TPA: DUF1579 domain-containing protein [Rhizobacter sp.]
MPLPAAPHAPADFDFILGDWRVQHRRLDARLAGCQTWTSFSGRSSTRRTLGGFGNVEDNLLHLPEGEVRALAMRAYDPATQAWSIWWLDGRRPHQLDVPVTGRFTDGVGLFHAEDTLDGRPIRVRFTWRANPGGHPTWEQAFSPDAGASWETNWTMTFQRLPS